MINEEERKDEADEEAAGALVLEPQAASIPADKAAKVRLMTNLFFILIPPHEMNKRRLENISGRLCLAD